MNEIIPRCVFCGLGGKETSLGLAKREDVNLFVCSECIKQLNSVFARQMDTGLFQFHGRRR